MKLIKKQFYMQIILKICLVLFSVMLILTPCCAKDTNFKFSLSKGIVDFMYNPWSKQDETLLLEAMVDLKPGIINRLGFLYGGQSGFYFEKVSGIAKMLKSRIPSVVLGGGFPEVVRNDYHELLPCDAGKPLRLFEAKTLSSRANGDGKMAWMDFNRPDALAFYECIGKILIRQGFSHFHFEQGMTTVRATNPPEVALQALRQVETDLSNYAQPFGLSLSFSGDPELAQHVRLDAVYMPSRFYINDFAREDRNRIELPGVANGYSYALSDRIVRDTVVALPKTVTALFYVDNFDASQDDLRRMMELTADARRDLIIRSSVEAAAGGAVFIPSVNHCEGCIARKDIVDTCELVDNGNSTEYDAARCKDMSTIAEALFIQRRSFKLPN